MRPSAAAGVAIAACLAASAQAAGDFTQLNKLLSTLDLELPVESDRIQLGLGSSATLGKVLTCNNFAVGDLDFAGEFASDAKTEYGLTAGLKGGQLSCAIDVTVSVFGGQHPGKLNMKTVSSGIAAQTKLVVESESFDFYGPSAAYDAPGQNCDSRLDVDNIQVTAKFENSVVNALLGTLINLVSPILVGSLSDTMCGTMVNASTSLAELIINNTIVEYANLPRQTGSLPELALAAELAMVEQLDPAIELIGIQNVSDAISGAVGQVRDFIADFGNVTSVQDIIDRINGTSIGDLIDLPVIGPIELPPELENITLEQLSNYTLGEFLLLGNITLPDYLAELDSTTLGEWFELINELPELLATSPADALARLQELINFDELFGNSTLGTIFGPGFIANVTDFLEDLQEEYMLPFNVSELLDWLLNGGNSTSGGIGSGELDFDWNVTQIVELIEEFLGIDIDITGDGFLDIKPLLGNILTFPVDLGEAGSANITLDGLRFRLSPYFEADSMTYVADYSLLLPAVGTKNLSFGVDLIVNATVSANLTSGEPVDVRFNEALSIGVEWGGVDGQVSFMFGFHRDAIELLTSQEVVNMAECLFFASYIDLSAAVVHAGSVGFSLSGATDGVLVLASSVITSLFPIYQAALPNSLEAMLITTLTDVLLYPTGECVAHNVPTAEPTANPTASPTPSPTDHPSKSPTASPVSPTAEPTASPVVGPADNAADSGPSSSTITAVGVSIGVALLFGAAAMVTMRRRNASAPAVAAVAVAEVADPVKARGTPLNVEEML